jgi:hypothetical protein
MNFCSEFGEDKWIAENLPLPATGFYVDVGCAHPTEGSNTAFLRARGWQGLAIDANPLFADKWETAGYGSHFVQAFVSDQPIVPFDFSDRVLESRVSLGGPHFAAVDLWSIVEAAAEQQYPKIHFLTLDLEGHEINALRSLIDYYPKSECPPIIVSEYNTLGLGEDLRVRDYLLKQGYRLVHTTRANHIFHRA